MERMGYKNETINSFLSFKLPNDTLIKCSNEIFGNAYTEENIKQRIENEDLSLENIRSINNKSIPEDEQFEYKINTIANDMLILKKYGINSYKNINSYIYTNIDKINQNEAFISSIKEDLSKIYSNPTLDNKNRAKELNIKLKDLYNENKFLNIENKNLSKIQKNNEIYFGKDLSKNMYL